MCVLWVYCVCVLSVYGGVFDVVRVRLGVSVFIVLFVLLCMLCLLCLVFPLDVFSVVCLGCCVCPVLS